MRLEAWQIVKPEELEASIKRALEKLRPEVVKIGYKYEDDWDGEPRVSYQVVLTDRAFRNRKQTQIPDVVRQTLRDELNLREKGVTDIHFFRTDRSLLEAQDKDWIGHAVS
jgi:hypothetical protein